MSHRMKFLKQESTFHPLPRAALLFSCWKCFDHYGWTTYADDHSEVLNILHMESMPPRINYKKEMVYQKE
jgi:hypothetical protein